METEEGARFTLRLAHEDSANVVYEVDVELGEVLASGRVTVELSQGSVIVESDPVLPGWLQNTMVGLVRSLWRARRGAEVPPAWPRRLTRWRHPEGAQVR